MGALDRVRSLDKVPPHAMAEMLALASAIEREEMELSFDRFVRNAWHVMEPSTALVWNWHMGTLCGYLQALYEGRLRAPRLIINIPPGTSKPVHIDEPVLTSTGFKPLRDIRVGDRVLTHRGRFRPVTAVHEQGVLPTCTVDAFSGRRIRAAPDHPFMTTRGWVAAGELVAGDYLGVPHRNEDFDEDFDESMSAEEARLLGYLVGDGCISQRSLSFVNNDDGVIADFIHCADAIGFHAYVTRHPNGNVSASKVVLKSTATRWGNFAAHGEPPVLLWLKKHGLYLSNSYTKRIPVGVFGGERAMRNFLGAYWSCDGTFSVRHKGAKTTLLASATTVSLGLAEDLQRIGMALNIALRVRVHRTALETKSQPGGTYVSYNVLNSSRNEIAKFIDLPGLCASKNIKAKVAFMDAFDPTLYPDEVVGVRRDEDGECRCLTVDEDESFTANGVAVHNSLVASVFWPAWIWSKAPDRRFLVSSNDKTLVTRDNLKMRSLILSEWFQSYWGDVVKPDKTQWDKEFFQTLKLGFRQGVTMKGAVTGKRGDCLPAETVITTDRGPMTIREIHCAHDKPRVAAVDRGTMTWSAIVATREIDADELVELQTDAGRTIRATPGHLFGVGGDRYIEAARLCAGDRLVVCIPPYDRLLITRHTVGSIRRVRRKGIKVYDIQVEKTHNFFADGFLVHNCQIVDDPHDAKKALNASEVQAGTEAWDQGMSTRVNNMETSLRLIIMQRLRTNDLTGHILAKKDQEWVNLVIPMTYTGRPGFDPVKDIGPDVAHLADPRTKVGELLDPVRFPKTALMALRTDLGEYGWSGQMQQDPVPLGGGIIKKKWWVKWEAMHNWSKYHRGQRRKPPLMKHVFWSWDTAFTEQDRKDNAYTAGTKWGLFFDDETEEDRLMLINAWHGRVAFGDLKKRIRMASKEDTDAHLIERKASGISVIQELRRDRRVKIRSYDPRGDGDKESRAMLTTAHFERGLIVYPDRPWSEQLIDWVAAFPSGAPPSADYTDTVSQAILYVVRRQWIRHPDDISPIEPEPEEDEDEAPQKRHGTYG